MTRRCFTATTLMTAAASAQAPAQRTLRAGIVGLDSSHCTAFTGLFHKPIAAPDGTLIKVTAACPGSTKDAENLKRAAEYTEVLRAAGVAILTRPEEVAAQCDVLLLQSVDGAPHLEEARPLIAAGKPLYVDKPAAGSLADAASLLALAAEKGVPCFSSSALRFAPDVVALKGPNHGAQTWGPFHRKEGVPPIYYYGIHGVESLFTLMGAGCRSVVCSMEEHAVVATGTWVDGRPGTFRGLGKGKQEFGATVFTDKAVRHGGTFQGYDGLIAAIAEFFVTQKPPVSREETLEIFAFMDAAALSAERKGAAVTLEEAFARAGVKR